MYLLVLRIPIQGFAAILTLQPQVEQLAQRHALQRVVVDLHSVTCHPHQLLPVPGAHRGVCQVVNQRQALLSAHREGRLMCLLQTHMFTILQTTVFSTDPHVHYITDYHVR